jgi:hypothetical protein
MTASDRSSALRRLGSRLAAGQSFVLLTLVYCLALPVGLYLRLRDPLEVRGRSTCPAWRPRSQPVQTDATLRRLF